MVDVTATETGVKKTTVTLEAGRYRLSRLTSYLLHLGTAVSPFPPPPVPITITAVNPIGTEDPIQVFEILGTSLDQVETVTAYVEPTEDPPGGEYGPLIIDSQAPGAIYLNPGMINDVMAALGVSKPFQIRFRLYAFAMLQAESDPVSINNPSPPVDPLADAFFPAYTGSPGQLAIDVAVGAGYQLAAMGNPGSYIQYIVPSLPLEPTQSFSFAVWFRRRDFPGGLITFANWDLQIAANANLYNGALENIIATVGGIMVDSPPASYPSNDFDWHMVVVRSNGTSGEIDLYVDGVYISSSGGPPLAYLTAANPMQVGRNDLPPLPQCQATGAIWHRVLTEPEIQLMYNNTAFPP